MTDSSRRARRVSRLRAGAIALAALLAASGCDPGTGVGGGPPAIVSTSVVAADGPITRVLRLRLAAPAAVEVEYATEGAPRLRVTAEPAAEHEIFLPRLRAGATYDYSAVAVDGDGRRGEPADGSFSTGPLPPEMADVGFAAEGTPSNPLTLLVISRENGWGGFVVVDAGGHVVWYLRADGAAGIARRTNGNFAFVSRRGLMEVTPRGEIVAELPSEQGGRRFHHDVIATPANTLLAIANDTQTVDGTHITGEAVWEWSPETGQAHRRWTAFDFLDPFADRGPRFSEGNWMHANSLALGGRGNVILSSNYLNQIMSISPDFSQVEWRMGGPNATIAVPDEERFSGQHTAAELENGRILLFDNRREQGVYSRAVEFALVGSEARREWEWRPERDNFALAVSSARRLAGDRTLVAFGMDTGLLGSSGPTEVYEVTRDGEVLWHLEVSGIRILYRAEALSSIAGEVPAYEAEG